MKEVIELLSESAERAAKELDGNGLINLQVACSELFISNAEARQKLEELQRISGTPISSEVPSEEIIKHIESQVSAVKLSEREKTLIKVAIQYVRGIAG